MLQAAANHNPARQQLEEVFFFFFCSQRRMLLWCECWCHLQCTKLQHRFVVVKKTARTRRQNVTHNMTDFDVLQVKTRSSRADRNFHLIRHSLHFIPTVWPVHARPHTPINQHLCHKAVVKVGLIGVGWVTLAGIQVRPDSPHGRSSRFTLSN